MACVDTFEEILMDFNMEMRKVKEDFIDPCCKTIKDYSLWSSEVLNILENNLVSGIWIDDIYDCSDDWDIQGYFSHVLTIQKLDDDKYSLIQRYEGYYYDKKVLNIDKKQLINLLDDILHIAFSQSHRRSLWLKHFLVDIDENIPDSTCWLLRIIVGK